MNRPPVTSVHTGDERCPVRPLHDPCHTGCSEDGRTLDDMTALSVLHSWRRQIRGTPAVPDDSYHPRIVCLCGSTRFYTEFQQAYYDQTMRGEIVLSVGFYPHVTAAHGHGEGVGHDSEQKIMLDELHKRKIDLADYMLVVSDITGYYGSSTLGEIQYALDHGKPVEFTRSAARQRCLMQYQNKLLDKAPSRVPGASPFPPEPAMTEGEA